MYGKIASVSSVLYQNCDIHIIIHPLQAYQQVKTEFDKAFLLVLGQCPENFRGIVHMAVVCDSCKCRCKRQKDGEHLEQSLTVNDPHNEITLLDLRSTEVIANKKYFCTLNATRGRFIRAAIQLPLSRNMRKRKAWAPISGRTN